MRVSQSDRVDCEIVYLHTGEKHPAQILMQEDDDGTIWALPTSNVLDGVPGATAEDVRFAIRRITEFYRTTRYDTP